MRKSPANSRPGFAADADAYRVPSANVSESAILVPRDSLFQLPGRVFPFHELVANVNKLTLALDCVIGVSAAASNPVDQFIESKAALPYIPIYAAIVLGLSIILPVINCFNSHRSVVKPEDPLIMRYITNPEIIALIRKIKMDTYTMEKNAMYLKHLPTLLISLGMHVTYITLLSMQNNDSPNPFVAFFDWLAPTAVGGMLLLSTLLTNFSYVRAKKAESIVRVDAFLDGRGESIDDISSSSIHYGSNRTV